MKESTLILLTLGIFALWGFLYYLPDEYPERLLVFLRLRSSKQIKHKAYLEERNKELKLNINNYTIGQEIKLPSGQIIKILDKTRNSLLVYIPRNLNFTDQEGNPTGINSTEWQFIEEFEERFGLVLYKDLSEAKDSLTEPKNKSRVKLVVSINKRNGYTQYKLLDQNNKKLGYTYWLPGEGFIY